MNEQLLVFFEVRRVGNRKENWFGHVLYASGNQVSFELEQIGRDWDEWGCIENPTLTQTGVMLWEGVCFNANITQLEWEPDFRGEWRQPTAEELFSMLVPAEESSTGGERSE